MKILSAEQIRKADEYTIRQEPIASIDLMERAASACVHWIVRKLSKHYHFSVFCGTGNNGGDGLAIARLLYERGNMVDVYIVRSSKNSSPDFQENEKRLKEFSNIRVYEISNKRSPSTINHQPSTIIIDCLFGTGLNKPVTGIAAEVIQHINSSHSKVVSIDLPSGLFAEDNSKNRENIVHASYTLTFQQPKLSFMFPANGVYVGEFVVLDIGLDQSFIEKTNTRYHYITLDIARSIHRPRQKFSHKGTYGHALLVSGSKGKMGAAILGAKACLRAGVGLLTVHVPSCGNDILQNSVAEAMVEADEEEKFISGNVRSEQYDAIGVGPGIGKEKATQGALKLLIQNCPVPLVLDADALNILSENKTWLSFLPKSSILTPHPKEFERLAGKWDNDEERLEMQEAFSKKYKVYVVLKGAHTCITCPDGEVFFNSTGNPGMATGGSGDVLTGILAGLMAQGYDPKQAAVLGVYLHGLAGDLAAKRYSQEAMVAGDIVRKLGDTFKRL